MTTGIEQIFNDPTLVSLKITLQAAAVRHEALASNVANVNTPGYHRVDLTNSFKSSLDSALHKVDQGGEVTDMPQATIATSDVQNPARFDGNTVNLDQEMTEMIKNQTDFDFSSQMLALQYSSLKSAMGVGNSSS